MSLIDGNLNKMKILNKAYYEMINNVLHLRCVSFLTSIFPRLGYTKQLAMLTLLVAQGKVWGGGSNAC
jgi:hypothetical protein